MSHNLMIGRNEVDQLNQQISIQVSVVHGQSKMANRCQHDKQLTNMQFLIIQISGRL